MKLQDDLVEHKCLCFNKNYQDKFDEKLKQQFLNTYKYSNHNINMFIIIMFILMSMWITGIK